MSDQLARSELHICNNIYLQLFCKKTPFYPTKLAFKRNLRNLNRGHWLWWTSIKKIRFLVCKMKFPRSSPNKGRSQSVMLNIGVMKFDTGQTLLLRLHLPDTEINLTKRDKDIFSKLLQNLDF